MRVSKEPEVRKQEILDTAMKIFSEKGYEATTMKDIAREMNVASGLCYHYFQNKQILYETAVRLYAKSCAAPFVEILGHAELSLDDAMERLGAAWKGAQRGGVYTYESFFHKKGNELFHRQLDMEMIREILPFAVSYLEELRRRGEIRATDPRAAALFLLHGQIGIINDRAISEEKSFALIRELILKILK